MLYIDPHNNKNASEVDIRPASGKIIKNMKYGSRVPGQGVPLKGTRSRCAFKGYVKDNNYARFHTHSYHRCR